MNKRDVTMGPSGRPATQGLVKAFTVGALRAKAWVHRRFGWRDSRDFTILHLSDPHFGRKCYYQSDGDARAVATLCLDDLRTAIGNQRPRVCQAFCVNGRSFPCAAGILGGGKVGILVLDFHFSTAHSFSSFLIFLAYKQQQTTGVFRRLCEMRACRRTSPACPDSSLANLLQPSFLPATLTRLAEPGRPAESQNAATPPSSSALAWSTSWQYAPAPGTATSALHPQSETTLVS